MYIYTYSFTIRSMVKAIGILLSTETELKPVFCILQASFIYDTHEKSMQIYCLPASWYQSLSLKNLQLWMHVPLKHFSEYQSKLPF